MGESVSATSCRTPADPVLETLHWSGSENGIFSLLEAWDQVRSRAALAPWAFLDLLPCLAGNTEKNPNSELGSYHRGQQST